MKSPCKGSEYRVLGCHSTCAAYIKYNNHQVELRESRDDRGDVFGYVKGNRHKIKRRMRAYKVY